MRTLCALCALTGCSRAIRQNSSPPGIVLPRPDIPNGQDDQSGPNGPNGPNGQSSARALHTPSGQVSIACPFFISLPQRKGPSPLSASPAGSPSAPGGRTIGIRNSESVSGRNYTEYESKNAVVGCRSHGRIFGGRSSSGSAGMQYGRPVVKRSRRGG